MYITDISLKGFRNYLDNSFSFIDGNNIIIGPNGAGKTNLLEAIYLLGLTKSFRKRVSDIDLVMRGGSSYFVEGNYSTSGGLDNIISLGFHNGKKRLKHNGNIVNRFSDIIGSLRVLSFLQEDISLVLGSPSVRRNYLDMLLSLSYPLYFKELRKYRNIIKQRNVVLKGLSDGVLSKDSLFVWDEQFIESGSILLDIRHSFFSSVNNLIKDLYNSLGFDIGVFEVSYKSSIGSGNSFRDLLRTCIVNNLDRELLYKQSLYGPHKDDFLIQAEGVNFSRFASQGQSRACALILKLAMVYYIEGVVKEKSVLLFDDVLLDLDEKKKDSFFTLLSDRQNIFTSTSLYGFAVIEKSAKLFRFGA